MLHDDKKPIYMPPMVQTKIAGVISDEQVEQRSRHNKDLQQFIA